MDTDIAVSYPVDQSSPKSQSPVQYQSNTADSKSDSNSPAFTETSTTSSGFWEDSIYLSQNALDRAEVSVGQGLDKPMVDRSQAVLIPRVQTSPEPLSPIGFASRTSFPNEWTRSESNSTAHRSLPSSFKSRCSAPGTLSRHTRVCSVEDSSESEEDLEWLETLGRPKTRFEAALRRARLAERRRKLMASSKFNHLTGRTMPDWGSPIHRPSPSIRTPDAKECVFKNSDASQLPSSTPVDRDIDTQSDRLPSPERPYGFDLCTGIDTWLKSRPRWLYEPMQTDIQALQLCFISRSEQKLFDPVCSLESVDNFDQEMAVSDPIIESQLHGAINEAIPSEYPIDSEEMDDTSNITENSSSDKDPDVLEQTNHLCQSSSTPKRSLLRDHGENENLWQRVNELDRFCGLYLEQLLQDCVKDEKTELELTKRLEQHQRLHVAAELAISQLPKLAQMQAEVEQHNWSIPSAPVSNMLKISPKPRTLMSDSSLNQFSLYQVQLIMNDLVSSIHNMNNELLQELSERDELHLELGRIHSKVERYAAHFKDLCVRVSVNRLQRQLSDPSNSNSPKSVLVPWNQVIVHTINHDNNNNNNNSRSSIASSNGKTIARRASFIRTLFNRKSTRF